MAKSWDVVWREVDSVCQSAPHQQGRQDAADTEDSSWNHDDRHYSDKQWQQQRVEM